MTARFVLAALAASLVTVSPRAQSLILNGDFEDGNTAFMSSCVYSHGDIFIPARYDVSSNPRNSHTVAASYTDHTSSTGLMMVVNASTTTPNIVWSQAVSVDPNTLYKFEFWASSWYASPPAQLAFYVDGVEIGSRVTAPATTKVWTNFYWLWQSDAQSTVSLDIRNTTFYAAGNDFALDDIVLEPALKGDDLSICTAVEISWSSTTSLLYQVEWCPDLQSSNWVPLAGAVVGNGTTNSVFHSLKGASNRYYRVQLLP
jgi:hypothetical protein